MDDDMKYEKDNITMYLQCKSFQTSEKLERIQFQ